MVKSYFSLGFLVGIRSDFCLKMPHTHPKVVKCTWVFFNHPVFLKKISFVVTYLPKPHFMASNLLHLLKLTWIWLFLIDLNIFLTVVVSKANINLFQKEPEKDFFSVPIKIIFKKALLSLTSIYLKKINRK